MQANNPTKSSCCKDISSFLFQQRQEHQKHSDSSSLLLLLYFPSFITLSTLDSTSLAINPQKDHPQSDQSINCPPLRSTPLLWELGIGPPQVTLQIRRRLVGNLDAPRVGARSRVDAVGFGLALLGVPLEVKRFQEISPWWFWVPPDWLWCTEKTPGTYSMATLCVTYNNS